MQISSTVKEKWLVAIKTATEQHKVFPIEVASRGGFTHKITKAPIFTFTIKCVTVKIGEQTRSVAMDSLPIDWTGLSDSQKKAVEAFRENQKGRYFIAATPEMRTKDFIIANKMKQSSDPNEVARGIQFEQSLFQSCYNKP